VQDILARVGVLFRHTLNIDVPSDKTDLIQSGLLDSLALVELLLELERDFGVSIPLQDLDIENFRTVERIGAFVESLIETGPR
jgi:methoxymalonate biosynthesis acyl carrier protein